VFIGSSRCSKFAAIAPEGRSFLLFAQYVDINLSGEYSKDFHSVRMPSVERTSYETTILVRDSCLCLHVQRAARALARRFDEALRPLGLTNGQFSLMMSLNRPEPPAMGAMASLLAMDRTTLTAALKPLGRRGLLVITTGRDDRRARLLELTPKGRKLLARAVPVWKSAHAAVEDLLVQGEPDRLRKDLRALS
jgi:DNA-binding MarR family transcriptional regulator